MSIREVKEFDEELTDLLEQSFPGAILNVPHRVFVVVAQAS
jgi:hypothetical protein